VDELLDDARASPDDDAPRLVWADAVGGERGELVVLQCDLARGELTPDAVASHKRRQRELLDRHGRAWSGLAGVARRCTFSRGFVEAAEIDTDVFLARADDVFRAAPLLSAVTVTGLTVYHHDDGDDGRAPTRALLRRLFGDPRALRLRGLNIAGAAVCFPYGASRDRDDDGQWLRHGLGDDAVDLWLRAGGTSHLRALGFTDCGLSSGGLRALVDANALAAIERLWIRDSPGTEAVVAALACAPRLTAVHLEADVKHSQVLPAIPASVVELTMRGEFDNQTLHLLADCAPQLERLALHDARITTDAAAFARFPRLRSLDLYKGRFGSGASNSSISRDAFDSFIAASMPALRELSCPLLHSPAWARAIIEAFGSQLDVLDVRGDPDIEAVAGELQARMRGELRAGPWVDAELLHVGGRAPEPWWDRATIVV
jgi:hypothetical protein